MFRTHFLFVILLVLLTGIMPARGGTVLYAELGVNGLTCSQCSRSVELKLRKLDFVKSVSLNLEHTNGIILFEEGKTIDFNRIARAVTDAGFSVRYLKFAVAAAAMKSVKASCYVLGNNSFQLQGKLPAAKDTLQLQLLGSNFMPPAAFKKWKPQLQNRCGTSAYFVTAN